MAEKFATYAGTTSAALYGFGKFAQLGNVDLFGNPLIDEFTKYNFDSVFGAPAFAYVVSGLLHRNEFKYNTSFVLGGLITSLLIYQREQFDATRYGHGIDYTDLIGGITCVALYTLFSLKSSSQGTKS